jgi:hypothetical protein
MTLPAKPDADRALIAEVALDIGKEAVSHLRVSEKTLYRLRDRGLRTYGRLHRA